MKNKILLIDDEKDILEFLSYNLIKAGYKIDQADNGDEGLKKLKTFKPDLIIVDVMMPAKWIGKTTIKQAHFFCC